VDDDACPEVGLGDFGAGGGGLGGSGGPGPAPDDGDNGAAVPAPTVHFNSGSGGELVVSGVVDLAAPYQPRSYVPRCLRDLGPQAQTAQLLISELMTNAVLHARTEAALRVRRGAGYPFEVEDHCGAPLTGVAEPGAEGGFGLRIVAALASAWGAVTTDSGKVVWFELADPQTEASA
jgi:hypothetical protein